MEVQDSGRDLVVESANFAFNSFDLVEEPKTFVKTYNHPNTNDNVKWREFISKDFDEMSAKEFGRNCIKTK
jgi:hypothetical protein